MTDEIEYEAELDEPPETVWRALEEPALREAWLAPTSVPAERGGPIDCEVLEADPPHRLKVAWRNADKTLDSEVEFNVTRTDGGSRLRIVHSGLKAGGGVTEMKLAA